MRVSIKEETMTDEAFQSAIDSLLAGNKDGLKTIYEAYVRLIYTVVLDVVGRREDAEDITSDFFIKLIRVAGQFKKGSPHKTWLVTIARNMSLDFMRKNNRELLVAENGDDTHGDSEALDKMSVNSENDSVKLSNEVENKAILAEDMRRAMKELTPKEREITDMKLAGGMKFREIAEVLHQPIGTVTWTYNQAIKKLRRCLKEYEKS
jgi:RNA polymerase sigma-70 factor (ECF subfamily)